MHIRKESETERRREFSLRRFFAFAHEALQIFSRARCSLLQYLGNGITMKLENMTKNWRVR